MHQTEQGDCSPDRHDPAVVCDRRTFQRIECNVYAHISINGAEVSNCIIKNISRGGARLLIPASRWVPIDFDIVGLIDNLPVRAKKVWRSGEAMGVRFVACPDDIIPAE